MDVQRITELPQPPARPAEAHKGTFGRVLVIGGSRGMSGAAALAGLSALRGGAGLVFLAVPESILPIVAAVEPSYLTVPLPEDPQGRLSLAARDPLAEIIPNHTALAVGPGWGRSADLTELARWLFAEVDKPMVIDADGLNALAEVPEVFSQRVATAEAAVPILTPHPGEFARLAGQKTRTVQENREELAARFARDHGVIVVLKGRGTVVTDGRRLAVNATGNPGLATGGTGDVLTGVIAALLAQRMAPFEAARLAVHLHGLAGDLAAERLSPVGLIASDLPGYLPVAWSALTSSS